MESLQPMDQHRSVGFFQHVAAHLNFIIRSDRHQVRVERRMMERTEGDAVWHGRRAKRLTVAWKVGKRGGASSIYGAVLRGIQRSRRGVRTWASMVSNPLRRGKGSKIISSNIRTLMHDGYPQRQAIAIAFATSKRKR